MNLVLNGSADCAGGVRIGGRDGRYERINARCFVPMRETSSCAPQQIGSLCLTM
jgi:hypothetical protein